MMADEERSTSGKQRVTIYDVADKAGVAISTVSRVLNNAPDVSDETREKVMRVVEALQFRRNRTARSLAQQELNTLAVAIPTFTTPAHTEFLKGVRDFLNGQGMDLLLCDVGAKHPYENLKRFLERGVVDGLLIMTLPIDEEKGLELKSYGCPIVLVGSESMLHDCYFWDDLAGARIAVRHLLIHGHQRIGMIAGLEGSYTVASRQEGYEQALAEAGLPFDPTLIQRGDTPKHDGFSEEAGYEAMQKLLAAHDDITAVFATSDVHAIGASRALREAGLKIPQDMALIGYDNIKVSRYLGLSTIDQRIKRIGEKATELLLRRVKGTFTELPMRTQVTPRLIVRSSSQTS